MELSEEQKSQVRTWVEAGEGLSEIQRKILDEFEVSMTYMDVRFLVIDLEVQIHDREVQETVDLSKAPPPPPPGTPGAAPDGAAAPAAGGVQVELDRVMTAGALVSGTVTFSDGVNARWSLDQAGRLALEASGHEGYRPTEEDLQAFQLELRQLLSQRGF